jgi:hypothetical protein
MKILAYIILLTFSLNCFSQDCKELPSTFDSYTKARRAIKEALFSFTDKLPYGKSSWIISANYYSCDGKTGYLIYTTDKGRQYIHEKIPLRVWAEFKNASSSGSYYVQNIKGRYRLVPE